MTNPSSLTKSQELKTLFLRGGVKFAGIFGSRARGDNKENSDLDILIKFRSNDKGLLDLIRLENDMSNLLGTKVDLVTEGSLSAYIKDSVFKNLKIIYGEK